MKSSLSLVAATALASVFVAAPLARQQMPVFRSEANYVEVTARVVDKDGKFIDGLTAKDFQITEDNRRANVEQLFRVDLPTPWTKATGAKPVMYRPGLANDLQVAEGRIYLIYLNSIPVDDVPITRILAKEFVNGYVQPEDVVAVWSTFGAVTFTSDKALLNKKIDEFLGSTDLLSPVPKTGDPGGARVGLASALAWLEVVQGRKKSVLLFSAGWGGIAPVFSNQSVPAPFSSDLLDRHDVQIYAVDTRGLAAKPPAPGAIPYTGIAGSPASEAAAIVTAQSSDFFNGLYNMKWLAEDSGGFAIINTNEFVPGFRRIVEENSTYYVLGYQSPASLRGNWDYRDINVKLTRPIKGARVMARKGYVARPN
jgi:VWFA-related protein